MPPHAANDEESPPRLPAWTACPACGSVCSFSWSCLCQRRRRQRLALPQASWLGLLYAWLRRRL